MSDGPYKFLEGDKNDCKCGHGADGGIGVVQLIWSVFKPGKFLPGNIWLFFLRILNLLLGRPASLQVAVCHRECRHRLRRVFEGQEGGVAESGAYAGSGAQPTLQRPPGARGRLADLRAAGSVWVSRRPPINQSHSVGSNYTSYTSALSSSSLLADVLRFDNTYSIFQAKRLSFSVEVLLPDNMQSPKANGGVQEPTTSWDQQQQTSTLLIMWPNLLKVFNVFTFSPLYERRFRPQEGKKIHVTIHYYRKEIFFKASILSFEWKFED